MTSLFDEKRGITDRRKRDDGPPPGCRDRRSKKGDRRQTAISEISFHEWTRYLLRFKKRTAEKAAAKRAAEAAKTASENSSNPAGSVPSDDILDEDDGPHSHL